MKRTALIEFVGSLIMLALLVGAYAMWYGSVTDMSAQAATLSDEITQKSSDVARISAAKATLAAISEKGSQIDSYFVATDEVVSFLEDLQATGKSLGATVNVASVSQDDGTTPQRLSLSLSIDGSFDAVMRTIGALEFLPRDITISSIALSSSPTSSGASHWVATGAFVVGSRKPDGNTAPKPVSATVASTTTSTTP